ncbi:hypothetical protein AAFF27_07580 [Xylophilus sp. GW821-FHT01B05]
MSASQPSSASEEKAAARGQDRGLRELPGLLQLLLMLMAAAFALGLGGCAHTEAPLAQADHLEEGVARPLRL